MPQTSPGDILYEKLPLGSIAIAVLALEAGPNLK